MTEVDAFESFTAGSRHSFKRADNLLLLSSEVMGTSLLHTWPGNLECGSYTCIGDALACVVYHVLC